MTRAKYTISYERDESGSWTGRLAEEPGVITQGSSIAEVRSRIRDALHAFTDDRALADAATFVDEVRSRPPR
jgi:predicted RNase H-like HicB family nuclease